MFVLRKVTIYFIKCKSSKNKKRRQHKQSAFFTKEKCLCIFFVIIPEIQIQRKGHCQEN